MEKLLVRAYRASSGTRVGVEGLVLTGLVMARWFLKDSRCYCTQTWQLRFLVRPPLIGMFSGGEHTRARLHTHTHQHTRTHTHMFLNRYPSEDIPYKLGFTPVTHNPDLKLIQRYWV